MDPNDAIPPNEAPQPPPAAPTPPAAPAGPDAPDKEKMDQVIWEPSRTESTELTDL